VKKKGDIVVTTVDASSVVDETVSERGGKVVRTRIGDVNVAVEVKRRKAVFGGEPIGTWIFPGVSLAPDGPLGVMKILELLSSTGKPLSELVDALPDYYMEREKVACSNERKAQVMKKVKVRLKEFPKIIEVLEIDGIRLRLEDGWVLVRPSGTEPYIRVTAEGRTPGRAREIAERSAKVLKETIQSSM